MRYIDLRSDTVTQPTKEMRKAMMEAEVGDDVYKDDPTINKLQDMAAKLLGKEAALFVPSGTMGNQLAIMAWTKHGDEIIAGAQSHIVHYEGGAPARLSGVNLALVDNSNAYIYAKDVYRLIRPKGDPHFPDTSLVCVENALCNGDVVPLEIMQGVRDAATELSLPVHMDGARIFNAAIALNTDVKELAACADSVMFCISKGLCAPIGSLLCGSHEFITRAHRFRKILGGGMRQAGVLAACGLVSLTTMVARLHKDHENAQYMAQQLNALHGITADESRVKINMVFWTPSNKNFDENSFVKHMYNKGIKVYGALGSEYRFVTSNDVTVADIDITVLALGEYLKTL